MAFCVRTCPQSAKPNLHRRMSILNRRCSSMQQALLLRVTFGIVCFGGVVLWSRTEHPSSNPAQISAHKVSGRILTAEEQTRYDELLATFPFTVNPVLKVDETGKPIFRSDRHPRRLQVNRAASQYLNYQDTSSTWMYTEVNVKSYSDATFYAVNGHAYGYSGLQAVTKSPFTGLAICSIWDQCTGSSCGQVQVLECGAGVNCVRFDGEGTGAKSIFPWNTWSINKSYGFLTQILPYGKDQIESKCYFYAEELGGWKLLQHVLTNTGGKSAVITGKYSFLETWTGSSFGDSREAVYGPVFSSSDSNFTSSRQITSTRFAWTTGSDEDTKRVYGYASGSGWGMASGPLFTNTYSNILATAVSVSLPTPALAAQGLIATESLPVGAPPISVTSTPFFLSATDNTGCLQVSSCAGALTKSADRTYCEAFVSTNGLMISQTTKLCLKLDASGVSLVSCSTTASVITWTQKASTFCNVNNSCLNIATMVTSLFRPANPTSCLTGTNTQLFSDTTDKNACLQFSLSIDASKKVMYASNGGNCVDSFTSAALGLWYCHYGVSQQLRTFKNDGINGLLLCRVTDDSISDGSVQSLCAVAPSNGFSCTSTTPAVMSTTKPTSTTTTTTTKTTTTTPGVSSSSQGTAVVTSTRSTDTTQPVILTAATSASSTFTSTSTLQMPPNITGRTSFAYLASVSMRTSFFLGAIVLHMLS